MKYARADYTSQLFGIELTLQTGCDKPLTTVAVGEWLEGIFRGCDVGDVRINRVFFKGRVEGSREKTLADHAAEQEAFPEAPLKRAALRAEEVLTYDELEEALEGDKPPVTSTLGSDLQDLLNRHSAENATDTPDFVLASYLLECLGAFEHAFAARQSFYSAPGHVIAPEALKQEPCIEPCGCEWTRTLEYGDVLKLCPYHTTHAHKGSLPEPGDLQRLVEAIQAGGLKTVESPEPGGKA